MKIKKGDTVKILTGKDVGKIGAVNLVMPRQNRVIVGGINMTKHHLKKSPKHPAGGIHSAEAPIYASNVMLICPNCKKPTRLASKKIDGQSYRMCKKCHQVVDERPKQ